MMPLAKRLAFASEPQGESLVQLLPMAKQVPQEPTSMVRFAPKLLGHLLSLHHLRSLDLCVSYSFWLRLLDRRDR